MIACMKAKRIILIFAVSLIYTMVLLGFNNNHPHSLYNSFLKSDTIAYYNNPESYSTNRSFSIYPLEDLTQKLKESIFLLDDQADKIKSILREYESSTYQSKINDNLAKQAANEALINIENILTDVQKKEWKSIKDIWWESVNNELNLSGFNRKD